MNEPITRIVPPSGPPAKGDEIRVAARPKAVSTPGKRLFMVCFRTVECFGILIVAAVWLLLLCGSTWGDKFHYQQLFDASVPVMVLVAVSAASTWSRYRKDALAQLAVLVGWAVWAALPRI